MKFTKKDREVYKKGQAAPVCLRHSTEKQDGFLRPASEINYELWSSSNLLGLRLFFVVRIGFSLLCFLFGLFLHQKDGFLFFDALMSFLYTSLSFGSLRLLKQYGPGSG